MTEPAIFIPVEPEGEPFFAAAADEKLRIQECLVCDRMRHPPRPVCPWCNSTSSEWRTVSGRGRIWSFVAPHPPLPAPFSERGPYNVVVVELDDDPRIRLVGNVVSDDSGDGVRYVEADQLTIGAEVEVTFSSVDGDPPLPRWRLIG